MSTLRNPSADTVAATIVLRASTPPGDVVRQVSAGSKSRLAPFLVFLLAFAVRLVAVGLFGGGIDVDHVDPSEYLALAHNIRFHGTLSFGGPHPWGADGRLDSAGPFLPTAARAPLYPLAIAGLWWRQAPPLQGIRMLQALLGALTALLVYCAALPVFGRACAVAAALAMGVAPESVYMTAHIMSETLFTCLLIAGLCLWGRRLGLLAGIVLGAATLTRAVLLPFVLVLALIAAVHAFQRTLHLKIVIGALLTILPWTLRNAVTQHASIPVATQGWGSNLLFGTIDVPYGSGNPWPLYVSDPSVSEILRTTQLESDSEKQMVRMALRRILAHPLHWLWLRTKQYPRLFTDSATYLYPLLPFPPLVIRNVFLCGNFLFLVLSIAGLVMARAFWFRAYHLLLFPIFLAVAQFPMLTDGRYSLPIVPVMVMFAAFAACRLTTLGKLDQSLVYQQAE